MPEYKEVTETIDVPKNTGIEGFILTVKRLLRLPRVQSINISGTGKVRYTYVTREDDTHKPIEIDFSSVAPIGIIRNNEMRELTNDYGFNGASAAVASMFFETSREHLFPVALVSGPGSTFWRWHERPMGFAIVGRDEAYGLPFLYDEQIPNSTLILCCAYTRGASMVDVKMSYKMLMPEPHQLA